MLSPYMTHVLLRINLLQKTNCQKNAHILFFGHLLNMLNYDAVRFVLPDWVITASRVRQLA